MRMYQLFKTKEERENWIKEMEPQAGFKVCFREPVKQLAKDTYLSEYQKNNFKYAVVYKFAD